MYHNACEAFSASAAGGGLDDCLGAVLQCMREVANFQDGSIFVRDPARGTIVVHGAAPVDSLSCPSRRPENLDLCPCLRQGGCLVLSGGRSKWPSPCRQGETAATCLACLPVARAGQTIGAVKLTYAGLPPQPTSRYLASLAAMAQAGALQYEVWNAAARVERTPSHAPTLHPAPPTVPAEPSCILEIRCFGGFEMRRNDRPVTPEMFSRGKALALLKILLLHNGRPVNRDVLCELLWPDASVSSGPNRLYGVVHALREVIEPHMAERLWRIVRNRADQYSLHLDPPHRVDLYEFQEHIKQGRAAERDPQRASQAMRCFEEACALYRGDLFEEEPYEEWCWTDRENLREHYLEALKSLARLCALQGDAGRSVAYYRRVLGVDPLREDAHLGIMENLWKCGRRKEALDQYECCARIMRAELGAEPLPETRRMRQSILQSLEEEGSRPPPPPRPDAPHRKAIRAATPR